MSKRCSEKTIGDRRPRPLLRKIEQDIEINHVQRRFKSAARAKAEIGEGVFADCRLLAEAAAEQTQAEPGKADLSSLSAMLSAKWKQGTTSSQPAKEQLKAGQVRSFRILTLDPAKKRIEVEVTG